MNAMIKSDQNSFRKFSWL